MDNKRTSPQQAAANVVGYVKHANASSTGPAVSDDAYARAEKAVEQQLRKIAKH